MFMRNFVRNTCLWLLSLTIILVGVHMVVQFGYKRSDIGIIIFLMYFPLLIISSILLKFYLLGVDIRPNGARE